MSDPLITVSALIIAGYLLLALEVFVIPGVGVAGLGGLACLLAGCWVAFTRLGSSLGLLTILGIGIATTGLIILIPKTSAGRAIVHRGSLESAHSSVQTVNLGDMGVAETDLRPAGIARFGELRESVVTDGDFVNAGTSVRVAEIEGARILVELIETSENGGSEETAGDK